ncbi:Reverse transcriptase domain-containing protein [Abeliophyllum distichum]|uniref:Reverse transcriptase domain-containing protein n=1 Tax=Abeliophyllum distichum TaxID=126358 RepID=A0ABD1VXG9_9LAMI
MTLRDIEMAEASEEIPEDITIEESVSFEDIDPRITGTDSQTSSGVPPRIASHYLRSISQVDATSRHKLLSFMDAYSEYNQISMYLPDEEHTSFVTNKGLYCYKVMSFGLKNARATYQKLVNKMFASQLGSTMEVYMDDMLVKSLKVDDHIQHPEKTFRVLQAYRIRLNPLKCIFGIASGKFLGYMLSPNLRRRAPTIRLLRKQGPLGSRNTLPRHGEVGIITHHGLKETKFDIIYKPRAPSKDKPLADFVAKFTNPPEMDVPMVSADPPTWCLFVDKSSGDMGLGTEVVLTSPEGHRLNCTIRFDFEGL